MANFMLYEFYFNEKKKGFERIKERKNMVKAFVNLNHLVTGLPGSL